MSAKYLLKTLLIIVAIAARLQVNACPQTAPVTSGLWYNQEKTAKIQIFKAADGKYYGKIVWLKIPDINGQPKVDNNNPDHSRRKDPILGLQILRSLTKESENSYDNGTIYDPKNGKTYSCKMEHKGDKLSLRGYIGFSLIGRTTVWTRAE
jgi:uncharacterized protein (DUF2147 family)